VAKVFILEDDQTRIDLFIEAGIGHDLTIAKSFKAAKAKFQPPYDYLFLDHDLGGRTYVASEDEETGANFCRWLGAAPQEGSKVWAAEPYIIIHSFNPDGAKTMYEILRNNGWMVVSIPFGPTILTYLGGLKP
jgi:hypothetical protein